MVLTGKEKHMNELELIAAELAIKTFTKEKDVRSLYLRVDNNTALSCMIKMGARKMKL